MKPKSSISGFTPFLIIIIIVVVAVGAYLLKTQDKTLPSFPFQNPSSTPDLTTEWEAYTSANYSFKHPKDLRSDTGAAGTGFESIRFRYMGPKQIESGRTQTSLFDGYAFVITKIGLVSEKTPEQWAAERRNSSKENRGEETVLSEIKSISIDKGKGVQYSVKNCFGDHTSSYVSYGNNVYEITQLYVGEDPEQDEYQKITELILSTFKFLK